MSRSTNRVLTGACAVMLGACALGAAAPAHAETSTTATPAGKLVTIAHDASALGSPRDNTQTTTVVRTGDTVEALCGFGNEGRDWVKIQANGRFGFVSSSAVQGGSVGLPRECPNEITSITIPAPGMSFASTTWGAPLEGKTCPVNYPFLDARTHSGASFFDTGKTHIPGLRIDRTDGVGLNIADLVATVGPEGNGRYLSGYANVSISSHLPVGKATLAVTCTNDTRFAKPV